MQKLIIPLILTLLHLTCPQSATAAVVFGLDGNGSLNGGYRWNAVNTVFTTSQGGVERSLDGGLRFSLMGGGYEAYRDQFLWKSQPSVDAFKLAVNNAFNHWTATDPVSKLGTSIYFKEDLGTAVDERFDNFVRLGSEIDLLAAHLQAGYVGTATFNFRDIPEGITLTSGTTGYAGQAISGADVYMNVESIWDLQSFEAQLTHYIGGALGLGESEDFLGVGFIDNNYSAADPAGTLKDSWASLVNPLNPGASLGLSLYQVPNSSLGIDALGVDILMEHDMPPNFLTDGAALQNDDFGGRQFLYPYIAAVPEPSAIFVCAGACGVACLRKMKSRKRAS